MENGASVFRIFSLGLSNYEYNWRPIMNITIDQFKVHSFKPIGWTDAPQYNILFHWIASLKTLLHRHFQP